MDMFLAAWHPYWESRRTQTKHVSCVPLLWILSASSIMDCRLSQGWALDWILICPEQVIFGEVGSAISKPIFLGRGPKEKLAGPPRATNHLRCGRCSRRQQFPVSVSLPGMQIGMGLESKISPRSETVYIFYMTEPNQRLYQHYVSSCETIVNLLLNLMILCINAPSHMITHLTITKVSLQ